MGRRDSNDLRWQEVKEIVHQRDKGRCRLLRVISAKEALILKKRAGSRLQRLDAAHFRAVSELPEYCYDPDNLVKLNRYSHEALDSCKDPITHASISKAERDEWWIKILRGNKSQFGRLLQKGLILLDDENEEGV
jgi:hypothetical protein